jgi:hypothetical protein
MMNGMKENRADKVMDENYKGEVVIEYKAAKLFLCTLDGLFRV